MVNIHNITNYTTYELKLDKFTASHKGQMELYLRWLNKYERKPHEEEPLGIILCADKSQEHVELLELKKSGIHVAQYLTQLPPRKLLEEKLKKAIEHAKEKYAKLQQINHPAEQEQTKYTKKRVTTNNKKTIDKN